MTEAGGSQIWGSAWGTQWEPRSEKNVGLVLTLMQIFNIPSLNSEPHAPSPSNTSKMANGEIKVE